MSSENGWEPLHPSADQLEWVLVPGTNVHLQFLKGQPSTILRAFAADFNAYIEPLRDGDSAGYTPTNSVATSNHLNGTAMDLNWNSHPFRVLNAGFDDAKIATARELLAFYENTMWWGNDWNSPKDAMHWNLDYDTYGSENVARVQDFIARKIRADGYSTFRRANNPAPPPPPIPAPAQLSRAEGYALRILNEGRRRGVTPKGIQIAFTTGIVESNITVYANQKLPKSLALPHDAVGNDGYSVGIFQQQVRDSGRGWWWGDEQTCMGVESSAGLFYDRLVRLPYNGTSKSPGGFAQQIQGSAYPLRYDEHWDEAVALYNKLAGITAPTQGDNELTPEQDQMLRAIFREQTQRHPSRSPVREPGEGLVDTWAGMGLNTDGNVDFLAELEKAKLGFPPALARLERVKAGQEPGRSPDDAVLAKNMLSAAARSWAPASAAAPVAVNSAVADQNDALRAQVAQLSAENANLRARLDVAERAASQAQTVSTAVAVPEAKTTGAHAAQIIDSVENWTNTALDMDTKQRAALTASIKVLEMKNGSQP